jgi:hypothetical protein
MSVLNFMKPIPDISGTIRNLVIKRDKGIWNIESGAAVQIDNEGVDIDVQHLIRVISEATNVSYLHTTPRPPNATRF